MIPRGGYILPVQGNPPRESIASFLPPRGGDTPREGSPLPMEALEAQPSGISKLRMPTSAKLSFSIILGRSATPLQENEVP
jgi:hypothetical protein